MKKIALKMFKKQFLLPLIVGALVALFFMQNTQGVDRDGAYVYFQYARNIATGHGLSLNPGEITFGVTNIIWTLILAGCAKMFDVVTASQIIGIILFSLTGVIWAMISFNITKKEWVGLIIGTLYVLNPIAIWQSISGMDTALYVFTFSSIMLYWQRHRFTHPIILGILSGLAFLNRVDFIILIPVFLVYLIIKEKKHFLKPSIFFLLAFVVVIFPWVAAVYQNTGHIIPATGKGNLLLFLPWIHKVTFSQFNSLGMWGRLAICANNIRLTFLGVESKAIKFILLPLSAFTFFSILTLGIIKRDYLSTRSMLAFLWAYSIILFVGYGLFFPLPNFRYFGTVIPIVITVAIIITSDLIIKKKKPFILLCSLLFILHVPVLLRSNKSYKSMVEVQNVRVRIGKWLKENTPSNSRIALLPIGAISFYSERYIVDMGGIVDPNFWQWQCIQEGYASQEPTYQCLKSLKADYIVDYTNSPSVSKVAAKYPLNFHLAKNIGTDDHSVSIYKCNF